MVKRKFKTFYGVLREAARWLVSEGVTHVAMEATGIYSMPVYHALLEHGAMMAPDDSRQTAVHRRTTEPWYRTKTASAFEDMLTTLRRTLITARISAGSQAHLTPEQTQAVLAAWHVAAA